MELSCFPTAQMVLSLLLVVQHVVGEAFPNRDHVLGVKGKRQQMLKNLTSPDVYDPNFPPEYEEDRPTTVKVSMNITSFDSVDQVNMDYSISFHLRQHWPDKRLEFGDQIVISKLEVDTKTIEKIWVPDIYFTNEKEGVIHRITVPNKLMHISEDGDVTYSMRLSLKLGCTMDIKIFPHDVQYCQVILESYTYTDRNVNLEWDTPAVGLPTSQELPQFTVGLVNTTRGIAHYQNSSRTQLTINFVFNRKVGYYVVQVYIPNLMIVVLSWVSFWLDIDAVPARVLIGILTVLTLTTMSAGIGQHLPRVSYIKAIDIWSFVCLFYVFAALLEYAYVNVLSRVQKRRSFTKDTGRPTDETALNDIKMDQNKGKESFFCKFRRQKARCVDKISRLLFPLTFTIFGCIYVTLFAIKWD